MISLNVKPYCNDCMHFEAVTASLYADGAVISRVIECEHREKCNSIERYLLSVNLNKEDHGSYEN